MGLYAFMLEMRHPAVTPPPGIAVKLVLDSNERRDIAPIRASARIPDMADCVCFQVGEEG